MMNLIKLLGLFYLNAFFPYSCYFYNLLLMYSAERDVVLRWIELHKGHPLKILIFIWPRRPFYPILNAEELFLPYPLFFLIRAIENL